MTIDDGTRTEDWRQFLRPILAVNFSIRRANGVTQNKAEMIEFIAGARRVERLVQDVNVINDFSDEAGDPSFALVSCLVTMNGKDGVDVYRNFEVFTQQPSGYWLSVHWQSREPGKSDSESMPQASVRVP